MGGEGEVNDIDGNCDGNDVECSQWMNDVTLNEISNIYNMFIYDTQQNNGNLISAKTNVCLS